MKLCKEPRSVVEVMELLGWKNRTKFKQKFIRPLIARGLLTMTIPDKPQSSKQKYITIGNGAV
ncbi:MAG: hypothetical protein KAS93_05495 [Gammaproteobacteria bacterium]|nr:hypothetical protein [Gammaproteobacteria bacterium]